MCGFFLVLLCFVQREQLLLVFDLIFGMKIWKGDEWMDVVVCYVVYIFLVFGDNCGYGNFDYGIGWVIWQEEFIDRVQLGQMFGCNGIDGGGVFLRCVLDEIVEIELCFVRIEL